LEYFGVIEAPANLLAAFNQLLLQLFEFDLILSEQRPLVDVFVDVRFVFDVLGSGRKLEGLM
jgi:hypothetical protein